MQQMCINNLPTVITRLNQVDRDGFQLRLSGFNMFNAESIPLDYQAAYTWYGLNLARPGTGSAANLKHDIPGPTIASQMQTFGLPYPKCSHEG